MMNMSDLSLLITRQATGFARDARFATEIAAEISLEISMEEEEIPRIDPLEQAHLAGFDAGYAAAWAEAEARMAEENVARSRFASNFAKMDSQQLQEFHNRLAQAVAALCEASLQPLTLDPEALTARINRIMALFSRADDSRILRIHPDDLALIAEQLPPDWRVQADPLLMRGALRVETPEGGAEDGPEQWRSAIHDALSLS